MTDLESLIAEGGQRLQGESAADPGLAGDAPRFAERARRIAEELAPDAGTRDRLAERLEGLRTQLEHAGS
jgi:hypothetical protein